MLEDVKQQLAVLISQVNAFHHVDNQGDALIIADFHLRLSQCRHRIEKFMNNHLRRGIRSANNIPTVILNGEPGAPGLPGGNLLVMCKALQDDGQKLRATQSRGQQGDNGQNGGNGVSGQDAVYDLKMFKDAVKLAIKDGLLSEEQWESAPAVTNGLTVTSKKKDQSNWIRNLESRGSGLAVEATEVSVAEVEPFSLDNWAKTSDLLRRHEAATYVDAVLIANTRTAGTKAGDMLTIAQNAYAEKGFEGEWNYHHQGGCAAYKRREWVANPSVDRVTGLNQAYAWNPSVAGTKSEDTILCYANAQGKPVVEVISTSPDWPVLEHTIGDLTIARPGILHLPY
ncbi:hypothetical protein BBJ28_00007961 [Nothophytophthora sp. Chile5]|nr:hypothetical protein BBJ28_00007961 [Nothophytophthora sp. Chile5]